MKLFIIILITFIFVGILGIIRSKISGVTVYGLFVEDIVTLFDYISYGFLNIISRFGAYPRNFDLAIDHFRSTPFFYGKGILMDLSFFIPGQTETIVFYFRNQFSNWIGGGGMPATMLGAFYLDFGVWGVSVLGGLAAASIATIFQIAKYKITNYYLKVLTITVLHISWLFGLQGTYFAYFLPIFLMYIFMILIFIFVIKAVPDRSYSLIRND